MSFYNFDHLILLVGTNPLPNFVIADFFLMRNQSIKKIWLVHSEENRLQAGTKEETGNLEKLLFEKHKNHQSLKFPLEKIAISDVSDASIIKSELVRKMPADFARNKKIHLNYTGGTKSMSTHAYWILRELESAETEFSYLDARYFRLISDKTGVMETDLRQKVVVSFDEMVRLHGFKRKNTPRIFIFSDALKIFQELIETDRIHEFYGEGGYDRECFLNDKDELAESIKKLSKASRERLNNFHPNQTLLSIIFAMPVEYQLFDKEGKFNEELQNKKFQTAVKFLDGDWLEHHIANLLQSAIEGKAIHIEQNWVINKPAWPENLDFEIDVLLINGYQLTGISCTTDTKKYCKNKGFEIIHRTRQIGGDEAKAVLVTRMDKNNRDKVQSELEVHTGGNQRNILVLGEADLKKERLIKEINKFVFNDED